MPSDKKQSSEISMLIFYIIAFAFVIFCIEYFGEIENDFILFERLHPVWLLAALIAQIGTYYLNAKAYQTLLLAYVNDKIFSLKEIFQISIVMLFFNSTIPSIGLSGNSFFSNLLLKKGIGAERSLTFILFELFIVYLSRTIVILAMIITGLFFVFPASFYPIFIAGLIAYALLSLLIVVTERKKIFFYIVDKFKQVNFIRKKLAAYKHYFRPDHDYDEHFLKIFTSKKDLVLQALGYNIGISGCDILTIYAIFLGSGFSISPLSVALVYIITQIITLLPTSPGSLLVYEGSMTYFFMRLGVPFGVAITVVLLYRGLSFWLPIPVGFFLQKKLQKNS